MSVKLYIRDNACPFTHGQVHEYGTDPHDSLILQDDGSIHYHNLKNGCGTMFPEEGYTFCDSLGYDPRDDDEWEAYLDIGGCPDGRWISVKEMLPQLEVQVLLRVKYETSVNEEITIGHLHQPRDFRRKPYFEWLMIERLCHPKIEDFHRVEYICPGSEYVTHWMTLPAPPNE